MAKYSNQTWHTILASINCTLICQALWILTDTACIRLSSSQDSSPDISATLWLIKLYKISHFLLIESYLASLTQAFIMMSKCADPSPFFFLVICESNTSLMLCLSRWFYMHLLVEAQWVWTVFQALFEQLIHIRRCFWIHSVCISCLWELPSLYGGMSLMQRKRLTEGGIMWLYCII